MDVSIIIPVKDEQDPYINACIESLKKQTFNGSYEIIVIGMGNRAQARNLGIKFAEGGIIAFIDSDCIAPPNWLCSIVDFLKQHKTLGGIGGVNISPTDSPFIGKVIDSVFSCYLGSLGSASLAQFSKPKYVNELACINSAFWTEALIKAGGFNEAFDLCEDTNLSHNVTATGYKLLLNPEIKVSHYRRDNVKRFIKQFFFYGVGRMRSILTSPNYASPSRVIPFVGLLIYPFIFIISPAIALTLVGIYFLAILIEGAYKSIKAKDKRLIALVPAFLLAQHTSFFFGMLYGLTKGKWKPTNNPSAVLYHLVISKPEKSGVPL